MSETGALPGPAHSGAKLILYTGSDDPEQVTAITGVAPHDTALQGESRGSLGTRARYGMWALESMEHVEGTDPATHLSWVLDRLEPASAAFAELVTAHADWRAVASVRSFQDVPRVGFTLPAASVKRVAALAADLRVGIIMTALELAVDDEVSDVAFSLGDATVSSSAAVDSDVMADHAAWLIEHATPLRAASPDATGHISISWARVASNGSITLPAPIVAGLAALEADLSYVIMTA